MKRKHHFVPQFYLRGFSCDEEEKRIHVFNLKRSAAFEGVSLKDQCHRHRFYGKEDDLEDAFCGLEGNTAPALGKITRDQCGPELGSADHKSLIMFVAMQLSRTAAAMASVKASLNLFTQAVFDGAPPQGYLMTDERALAFSLGNVPSTMQAIDDLRVHVVLAPKGQGFVTSDHPVSLYNHYCYGVKGWGVLGMRRRGLQVFLPLAPNVSVLLYDAGVYKVGRRGVAPCSVATSRDILGMNQLTFLASDENLYFADWEQREAIAREVCSIGKKAAALHRVTEAFEEGNERSSLLHMYQEQPTIDVPLSFVSVRREARRFHLFVRARQYRRPSPNPPLPVPPDLADGRRHVFRVGKHWVADNHAEIRND